jgi:DNA repair exonuclease SbcCD ATPase subunit
MRIKNLYLKDFKTIHEMTLTFDKKIILLEGKAGQGKTSIFEAIIYVLTDNLNEKIMEFQREKKYPFTIRCEFEHQANNYKIEINNVRNGVNKKLIINDDHENAYINSSATKKLAEIINPNITKYSAVSEQGKSTLLLFQGAAERLRQFKEILGIDNIGFIVQNIKDDIKENKNKIDILNAELNVLKNKSFTFQELPIIVDNEEQLKIEILQSENDKIKFELQNKLYENFLRELAVYTKAQKEIEENKIKVEFNKTSIEKKQSELKVIPEYDSELIVKLIQELSVLEKEQIEYNNQLKNYNDAQEEIAEVNKKIEQVKEKQKINRPARISKCEYTEEDITKHETLVNTYLVIISKLNNQIDLAKRGKCPTCGKEYITDINILNKELDSVNSLLQGIQSNIVLFKNTIKKYNDAIQLEETKKIKWQSDENLINQNQEQLVKLEKIIKPITKIFSNRELKDKIEFQTNLKKEYTIAFDFNSKINEQVKKLQQTLEITNNKIKELIVIEKPIDVEKPIEFNDKILEDKKHELIVLQQKKKEIERIKLYNENIELEKKRNNKEIEIKERNIDIINSDNRILESSKDVLDKDFSSFIVDKGCQYIKQKMNDLFSKTYGRYEVTFTQDKNSIEFFYNESGGIPRPVTMASGFEKQILAICCRVALCSLQNLGILLGDEIDSEASWEDSIKMMSNLLCEKSIQQFFLITHKDEIKEFIEQRNDSQKFSFNNGMLLN